MRNPAGLIVFIIVILIGFAASVSGQVADTVTFSKGNYVLLLKQEAKKVVELNKFEEDTTGNYLTIRFKGVTYYGIECSLFSTLLPKDKKVNIELSIKELNHKSTVSLKEGVKSTIDWMKEYYGLL